MSILNYSKGKVRPFEADDCLDQIRRINLCGLSDCELKQFFSSLVSEPYDIMVEAFAAVTEAVRRRRGVRLYDVQIIAGIAMAQNKIIQMNTGEGKTFAALFPACINAVNNQRTHILTFNDYLAKRDALWTAPVYDALGIQTGYIQEGMDSAQKKGAYGRQVIYASAKEAGFDYLRDQMCYCTDDMVQSVPETAIVDEADSILIDEARIPLVIAGRSENAVSDIEAATETVRLMKPELHYRTDEFQRNVYLTSEGIQFAEERLKCSNLYGGYHDGLLAAVNNALHARVLLRRDIDYVVQYGGIKLVDEYTGRIAENRHYPDLLQCALEAKEGLPVNPPGEVYNSITIQNYIGLYKNICGMTGTALPSAQEFEAFYHLDVALIPPNRPCVRIDLPDRVFTHKQAKYAAVVKEIQAAYQSKRPVLVGTSSIAESELLARMLKNSGVPCRVLNAKNDEQEARIIAKAGEPGAVTVSTNMAGRGVDIRLGGADEKAREEVVGLGGLYIIGTNRHDSRRIDDQLRGRAGRQGDPGTTRFFICLEDDLFCRYGRHEFNSAIKQETPLVVRNIDRKIAHIQKVAETQNFEIRKTLFNYSYILERQRRSIAQMRNSCIVWDEDKLIQEYGELCKTINGKEKIILKYIILLQLDAGWREHLALQSQIMEGIYLMNIGGKDPFDVYCREIIDAFEQMRTEVRERTAAIMNELGKEEFEKYSELKGPAATWTYLVNDNPFENDLGMMLISGKNVGFVSIAAMFSWPIMLPSLLYQRFRKRKE